MLEQVANVDCSYSMTPEELYAKVALSDALIVRSATKVHGGRGSDGCVGRRQRLARLLTCCLPPAALRLQVTRQVFEAAKGRLKVVGRAGVGVDNVDLAAATEVRRC